MHTYKDKTRPQKSNRTDSVDRERLFRDENDAENAERQQLTFLFIFTSALLHQA